jgi:hypothetical protein
MFASPIQSNRGGSEQPLKYCSHRYDLMLCVASNSLNHPHCIRLISSRPNHTAPQVIASIHHVACRLILEMNPSQSFLIARSATNPPTTTTIAVNILLEVRTDRGDDPTVDNDRNGLDRGTESSNRDGNGALHDDQWTLVQSTTRRAWRKGNGVIKDGLV